MGDKTGIHAKGDGVSQLVTLASVASGGTGVRAVVGAGGGEAGGC